MEGIDSRNASERFPSDMMPDRDLVTTMQHAQSTTSSNASTSNPLVALSRTLQALREQENVESLVRIALDYLRSTLNYPLVWLGLYDRLNHKLRGMGGVIPPAGSKFLHQQFALAPGDIFEQVAIQQTSLQIPDLREESRAGDWQRLARRANLQGTLVVPVVHQNICFGVALLGSSLWGESPNSDDRAGLSMLFGELAMGLYQADREQQRRRVKQPHEPLFSMMSQLQEVTSLEDRLRIIVTTTQQFLGPARTHVYWYDGEGDRFWMRASDRATRSFRNTSTSDEAAEIPASTFSGFYKTLTSDRLVAIGEAYSSLKADATSRLMLQIQARSLLAAPILSRGKLLGFLSVEGTEARIWQEEEKAYVRGAAQLVALTTPLSQLQERMAQIEQDRDLTIGLTQTISSPAEEAATLEAYTQRLHARLNAQHVLVLSADSNTNCIEVVYEYPNSTQWQPGTQLPSLSFVDWQLLQHGGETIALNLDSPIDDRSTQGNGDMRLTAWQPVFLNGGLRSPLIASTNPGRLPEGFVVVADEQLRTWTAAERELVALASRQIGLMLRQWQLQQQTQEHRAVVQLLRAGLQQWGTVADWSEGERSHLNRLAQVLQSPFVGLVTWEPGLKTGVLSAVVARSDYTPPERRELNVKKDRFLQKLRSISGIFGPVPVERLPRSSQAWLGRLPGLSLRAIALNTLPNYKATGAIVVADVPDRTWGDREAEALELFAGQLAWARRAMLLSKRVQTYRDRLEPLNWYKQHRLEDLYLAIGGDLTQLTPLAGASSDEGGRSLQQVREQELLRAVTDNLAAAGNLLKYEQWRLRFKEAPISIVRLFARVLDLVEPAAEKRQIWMQVHREGNATLYADSAKFELVFVEVLLAACRRSPVGGRIDIWYRPVTTDGSSEGEAEFLELSVTDSGELDARLLAAFQPAILGISRRDRDLLAASALDRLPGLEFAIFERVLRQMGGDFLIERLDDGRIVSRLLVRLKPRLKS